MHIFLQTIGGINDETRLRILRFIAVHGTVCVCDIERSFDMIQSRVSRHLKILKEAGFLRLDRKGRWAHYTIRTPLDAFRQSVLNEIACIEMEIPPLAKGCDVDDNR